MSRQLAPAGSAGANGHDQVATAAQAPVTEEEIVGYRLQDRFLPINNIQRLMKNSLPAEIKISKDAKECIQECTSEFISFITSEASDKAIGEKRKTITGDDILNALKSLGFDELSDVLLIYLAKYRDLQRRDPGPKRIRKSTKKSKPDTGASAANDNDKDDQLLDEENELNDDGGADDELDA